MGLLRRLIDKNPFLLSVARKTYGRGLYRLLNPLPPKLVPRLGGKSRLIVDMTVLSSYDYGTGIQRVGKKLWQGLEKGCANRIDITPVYATADHNGYFLALPNRACRGPAFIRTKQPLAVRPGDVFLGMDHAPDVILAQLGALRAMKAMNIPLFFLVHDLLPVLRPDWFSGGTSDIHGSWLRRTAALGHMVCVSRTVREQLGEWLKYKGVESPGLHWIHNGCDPEDFRGMGDERKNLVPARPYFLSVSTIEPRKGHGQTLEAFELLWQKGHDVSLVLAGKEGWLMQKVCTRLKEHPELGKRLFWYEDCDDGEIGVLYRNALAVLSASEAEGFGLSLVEGAAFGRPLILRDIPVFREIAGDSAFFFRGYEAATLAEAMEEWLRLKASGLAPDSAGVEVLSWDQSAGLLMDIMAANSSLVFNKLS